MQGVLLSVVIPAYNAGQYLMRCLLSILDQVKEEEVEVVCVNDGSTDNTASVLEELKVDYRNLVVVNQNNAGVSAARNLGIMKAAGKYLTFVDADDWVESNWWESLSPFLKEGHYDCVMYGMTEVGSFDKSALGSFLCAEDRSCDAHEMIKCMMAFDTPYGGYAAGKVIDTSLLKRHNRLIYSFEVENSFLEDEWFWLNVSMSCENVKLLSRRLYCYRVVDGALSRIDTTERNMHEIRMKERTYLFVKENYPEYACLAKARVALTVGGLVRRYYVLGDKAALKELRPKWEKYAGFSSLRGSSIPFSFKFGSCLCDLAMAVHLPVFLTAPFRPVLSAGMKKP